MVSPNILKDILEMFAMVSVSQFLVHYFLVTTSLLVLLFQLQTLLVCIRPKFYINKINRIEKKCLVNCFCLKKQLDNCYLIFNKYLFLVTSRANWVNCEKAKLTSFI